MKKKKLILIILMIACIIGAKGNSNAHSGRTDKNGGHKDKNNVSGLGGYHYHCGGYPAHLHSNGVCPYKSGGATSSNSKSTLSTTSKSTSSQSTTSITKETSSQTKQLTNKSAQNTTSNKENRTDSQTLNATINDEKVKEIEVESISIKNVEKEIEIGKSLKIETEILPENATNKNINWSSSDETIAKIDEQGNITPIKIGKVTITAKSVNQKTSSIELKIKQLPEIIKIKNPIEEMEVGENVKLETILMPEQSNCEVKWISSDDEIASINSLGNITAHKEGNVVITVETENNISNSITIKIKNKEIIQSESNIKEENTTNTILGVGLISGVSYIGYRKFRTSKRNEK